MGRTLPKDWMRYSIPVGPQDWDAAGQGLEGSTVGIRQGSTRACCLGRELLVFMSLNSSRITQRPPLASGLPELPPQRRGRAFLLGNAWVITAPAAVSTAGWYKSYWKCPNYIITLWAINFPSSTRRDFFDKPFLFLWCSLGVCFCSLSRMGPRSGPWVLNMSG